MQTRCDTCRNILEANKEKGISLVEIMTQMKASKSAVYTMIYHLRNHKGVAIKLKGDRYFIGIQTEPKGKISKYNRHIQKRGVAPRPDITEITFPFTLPKDCHKVSPEKKDMLLDLLKQAAYFYGCAEELIKVDKLVAF